MQKINATILADSIDGRGNRLITYLLTYPRIIHAEVMTHRMFSRNAASSRAIPFKRMVKMVEDDPFVPIAWQKDHKGMQGVEYITDENSLDIIENDWDWAMRHAIDQAKQLHNRGVTKQLCNRLLEPFQWYTCLITATEFENFFELRCPKYLVGEFRSKKDAIKFANTIAPGRLPDIEDTLAWLKVNQSSAEIHIQALAEAMWDARNESVPKHLQFNQWHLPFGDLIDEKKIEEIVCPEPFDYKPGLIWQTKLKIVTSRCARLSYMTHDGTIDYQKDIALHDQLLSMGHFSPFEHCARVMYDSEHEQYVKGKQLSFDYNNQISYGFSKKAQGWCNNLKGFISYRYIVENEKQH